MGNFFTSTQIFNNEKLSKDQFVDKFCKKMAEDGYVACDSDESELSYILRFADNCKWVAITSEAYEQGNQTSQKDTGRIAKMLGTNCVNTVVIDSDCAIMVLYDEKGKKADTLILGRADDYFGDDIPQPSEKIWKPFLCDDSTWELFKEICADEEVFVEDSLSVLAPIIGIDSSNILFSAEEAPDDGDTVFLYFKKVISVITMSHDTKDVKEASKKLTLNVAFKQVFGSELEKRGFKKLKSKYPYYVRGVNHEIIHTITYLEEHSIYKNQKSFVLFSGIGTIFRDRYDFSISPKMQNWLHNNLMDVYWKLVFNDSGYKYRNKNISSSFNCSVEPEQMIKDMKSAFGVVDNVLLYAMEKFKDIDSCMKHSELFNLSMGIYDDDDFGAKWSGYSDNEGLLYIHADNKNAITDSHYKKIEYIEKRIAAGMYPSIISYEVLKKNLEEGYYRQLNAFNRIRNSEVLYSKALSELKKRAHNNKETLLKYGLKL